MSYLTTDQQIVDTTTHLNPVTWEKVNRFLVRKAISEFAHEKDH